MSQRRSADAFNAKILRDIEILLHQRHLELYAGIVREFPRFSPISKRAIRIAVQIIPEAHIEWIELSAGIGVSQERLIQWAKGKDIPSSRTDRKSIVDKLVTFLQAKIAVCDREIERLSTAEPSLIASNSEGARRPTGSASRGHLRLVK